jgi:hypothetical protein
MEETDRSITIRLLSVLKNIQGGFTMNYNQNQGLNQLDENILIIGADVSKRFHASGGLSLKEELHSKIAGKVLLNFRNGQIAYKRKIIRSKF